VSYQGPVPIIGESPKPAAPLIKIAGGIKWTRDPGISDLIDYFDEPRFENVKRIDERFSLLTATEARQIAKIAEQCRQDFTYASRNFFWITTKTREKKLFKLWESQELIYEHMLRMKAEGVAQRVQIIKARQLGALDPETKVLTADLRWVAIDSLVPGDEVIAVDETPLYGRGSGRVMRTATILDKWSVEAEAFKIVFESGRSIIATADHPFLCKKRGSVSTEWRRVKKVGVKKTSSPIIPGDQVRYIAGPWDDLRGFDDGWFSGLLDGEGSYRSKNNGGIELCVAQVAGPVLEKAKRYLSENGYRYRLEADTRKAGDSSKLGEKVVYKLVINSIPNCLKMIGQLRPERFIGRRHWEGKGMPNSGDNPAWETVASVEPLGIRRMVDIRTTTGTFIAEGLVTHNCSTLIEGLIAWRTMFFKNVNALVVSFDPSHAAYLFSIMQYIYDHMPWWLRPMISSREFKDGLVFDNPNYDDRRKNPGLNSMVSVQAANKRTGVGQGIRVSCAHISEYCDWTESDAREVIEEDLGHALADNDETFAILESTGKGAGTYAHKLWKKNVRLGAQAKWYPLFLPFFFESSRVLPPLRGWRPEPPEKAMRERVLMDWLRCDNQECTQYHERFQETEDRDGYICFTCKSGVLHPYELTDGQLRFMARNRKNSETDKESAKALKQELCVTANEAFQVSGIQVFPEKAQSWAESTIRPPKKTGFLDKGGKIHGCNPKNKKINPDTGDYYHACYLDGCLADHTFGDDNGETPLKIWREPEQDAEYVIGADIAEGLGGEADYSAAVVIKVHRQGGRDEVVAVFASNLIDTIAYANVLNFLGRWYNEAMLAPEVNRYDTTLTWLRFTLQYPNIYRWKWMDSLNPLSNKLGWYTQANSKPRLYQTFQRWLQHELLIINDENIAEEMKTFTKDDYSERGASSESGSHDDLLMACHPTGTLIRTKHGVVPIQEVNVGDWVLTHKGRFRPVEALNKRNHSGYIYEIDSSGRVPVRITDNHPILIWDAYKKHRDQGRQVCWTRYKNRRWADIQELGECKGKATGYPVPKKIAEIREVDLSFFVPSTHKVYEKEGRIGFVNGRIVHTMRTVPRFWQVDRDFLRLAGYFLAEGSTGKHNISFSSHERELPISVWLMTYLYSLGLNPGIRHHATHGSVVSCSSLVMNAFFKTFSKKEDKHLPYWMEILPPQSQKQILIGYLLGDGCFRQQGGGIRANTISPTAAHQLYEMSLRCGWGCAINQQKGQNGHHPQWVLSYSSAVSAEICELIEKDILECKRPFTRTRSGLSTQRTRIQDGFNISKIKSVKPIEFDGPVYNLRVAEDNSYVANGTTVHNCMISLYTAHESDWDDNFGGISMKRELTLEEAQYHLLCGACDLRWPTNSTSYDDTRCPRCKNLNVQAIANRTAGSRDKQQDGMEIDGGAWNPLKEDEEEDQSSYETGATRT
jgi:intein/homing endonuclease/phage FluMu protein Com